ncbi:MAG: hypothetical protein J6J86_06255, partial [Lachnospiraceae bacterium]|nr:hypothetical protein [Lachnospiraceae bacterium]
MKGLRQSRLLKAVAVVLLFFSLIGIPLSAVGEAYLAYEVFDGNWEEMFGGKFEDTDKFSDLFSTRIGQLAEYMELKNVLETDGVLDYNKEIGHVMDEDYYYLNPQGHTIGELIKRNSFFVEDVDSPNVILLEELFYQYPREQYYVYTDENGNAALGSAYIEKFIKDFYTDTDWILVDRYEDAVDIWNMRIEQQMKEVQVRQAEGFGESETAFFMADDSAVKEAAPVQGQTEETVLPEDACWVYTPGD